MICFHLKEFQLSHFPLTSRSFMSNSEYIIKFCIELGLNQQASICLGFGVFFWFKILGFYLLLSSHTLHLLTAALFKIFPTKSTVSCVSSLSVVRLESSCSCCLEPFDLSESCSCHKNGTFYSDTFMQTDHSVFEPTLNIFSLLES